MISAANSKRGIRLSDRQRIDWLRLVRTDNIGPVTFRDLILFCGSASKAIEMMPELNLRGGRKRPFRIPSVDEAEAELERIERAGARLVAMGEPDYPPQLKNCEAPPPLVVIKGNLDIFQRPAVAIVGSRNASIIGARFTEQIAYDLGVMGYAVVSGLARGIDAAAHRASLHSGTIAVLAGGLDKPYPPQNLPLYREIPERGGALITEMPMGAEPRAKDFPRRNRIVAALSYGLVVVEAAERSGSLISARMATEMGRIVFAVPGSPLDPRAKGTNQLLKQGATLITSAQDITDVLQPLLSDMPVLALPSQQSFCLSEDSGDLALKSVAETEREDIFSTLGPTPVDIDSIIRHTGLEAATIQLALLELDLAGQITRYPGNRIAAAPQPDSIS